MADLELSQGEAKAAVQIDYEDDLDVSAATFTFKMVASKEDTTALVTVEDASFDTTDAATGTVTFPLTATQTNQTPGLYLGQVEAVWSASNEDHTKYITISIRKAVV